MQTRVLIILLLLVLLAAVVIAVVVRRGNAKRDEEHRAEAQQMGSQADWLESAHESAGAAEVTESPAAADTASDSVAVVPAGEPAAAAQVSEDDPTVSQAADESPEVPMTRAQRREAREAAEGAQAAADGADAAGPAWAGAVADTDPDAERIAAAAGFRDEVIAGDTVSEDIASPANEWGGPREDTLDEEPTLENPVEDDLQVEPAAEEPVAQDAPDEEPTLENPVEDDLPVDEPEVLAEDVAVSEEPAPEVVPEQNGRRISGFLELRDGGFGVGSAAPIEDGAQPLDHPVQAYRDTMTFRAPGDAGYDSAEPDVWFYDAGAAERSGFRPADG